jgi:hypothetical protein
LKDTCTQYHIVDEDLYKIKTYNLRNFNNVHNFTCDSTIFHLHASNKYMTLKRKYFWGYLQTNICHPNTFFGLNNVNIYHKCHWKKGFLKKIYFIHTLLHKCKHNIPTIIKTWSCQVGNNSLKGKHTCGRNLLLKR